VEASRGQDLLAHEVEADNFRTVLFGKVTLHSVLYLATQLFQCVRLCEDRMPQRLRLEAAFGDSRTTKIISCTNPLVYP